jgi:hypothetical protein
MPDLDDVGVVIEAALQRSTREQTAGIAIITIVNRRLRAVVFAAVHYPGA